MGNVQNLAAVAMARAFTNHAKDVPLKASDSSFKAETKYLSNGMLRSATIDMVDSSLFSAGVFFEWRSGELHVSRTYAHRTKRYGAMKMQWQDNAIFVGDRNDFVMWHWDDKSCVVMVDIKHYRYEFKFSDEGKVVQTLTKKRR